MDNVSFDLAEFSAGSEFDYDPEQDKEITQFIGPVDVTPLIPGTVDDPQPHLVTVSVATLDHPSDQVPVQDENVGTLDHPSDQVPVQDENVGTLDHPSADENIAECDDNYRIPTRKRQVFSQKWEQNLRKMKRQRGDSYKTKGGKLIASRLPRTIPHCKCKFGCRTLFSDDDRSAINSEYWNLGSYSKQQLFLRNCIEIKSCKRYTGSRRSKTCLYKLRDHQVCKKYFMATLNLSDGFLSVTCRKMEEHQVEDLRGAHGNQRKIDETEVDLVKSHIESFPAMESHYTRMKSQRKYLASNLNISRMFDLFKEQNPTSTIKEHTYRRIFCHEYNYSFHRPKKDVCLTCVKYSHTLDKTGIQEDYDNHIKNKEMARLSKTTDKEAAKINPTLKVYTFDLQSVLSTPCSNVSSMYYSRKFATYNNTFFDLATKEGFCYPWNETDGNRGSDEIGSTFLKRLMDLPPIVSDVILYSDCCGGQNRNRFIASLLVYINLTERFETVSLKFLESGHTQMEADSMHSAIERCKKNINVYTPDEWPTILRNARRNNPFIVEPLQFTDLVDLKKLFTNIGHTLQKNSQKEKVNWLKIKALQVEKGNKLQIKYKESWNGEYKTIDFADGRRKARADISKVVLTKKFTKPLAISQQKLKDLKGLCDQKAIPISSHKFFLDLVGEDKRDSLDEPDVEEDDVDDCG